MSKLYGVAPLVAGVLFAAVCGAAERDWDAHPAVVQLDTSEDIYAIGDIHGDYVRAARALTGAGVIEGVPKRPQEVKWIANRSVLVVTGDMIDKGPRMLDVLRFVDALQRSAAAQGGRVVLLAGNHEAEFLANPAASKGRGFAEQLIAEELSPAAVGGCKTDLGALLCGLPFAARVNDWFFSHAGNTAGLSLEEIRTSIEGGFAAHGFAAPELIGDHSLLEARLNGTGRGRELWIDAGIPQRDEQQLLEAYTGALGVKHIVEGHVPSEVRFTDGVVRNPGEMFQRFGMLFLIDTGMSEDVNLSQGAVLHITRAGAAAVCASGQSTLVWEAARPQATARAAKCQ